jgi:hypothetical protein
LFRVVQSTDTILAKDKINALDLSGFIDYNFSIVEAIHQDEPADDAEAHGLELDEVAG